MKEPFLNPLPRIVAHRGDSHAYPENTLEAFISAHKMGVDVIETDVHLTKDNHIIVWHDPTLERNTNGSGLVENYTLKELKQLDAGYTFTPDGGKTFPFRNTGIKMTTLDEALQALPDQRFNVDLKSKEEGIVDAFEEVVKRHNAEERILCASFHLTHLKRMREQNKSILTSLTTLEVIPLLLKQKLRILPKELGNKHTIVFQVPVEQWGIKVITSDFVKQFHKRGAVIQVWTINDEDQMRQLYALGVDSIMTDNPELLLKVAKEFSFR
ncbi:MAG: glycerophosphodiester phosphodiesterase [Sphaerochaetaceae bacterium]|jgi:glycerophosphoryl diester phosphodiesterase